MVITAPANRPVYAEVTLPASKSISNRLLIIRHLSGEPTSIKNLSEAEDTMLLEELLHRVESTKGSSEAIVLDCMNAGTVLRFLSAVLAITPGNWILTGSERMKQRPVGPLADALTYLGADVHYVDQQGYPPLAIRGRKLDGGKTVLVPGNVSSQFISALMLIAPVLPGGLKIQIAGETVSEPYIDMTAVLMNQSGVMAEYRQNEISIGEQCYSMEGKAFIVEPDWSSAAFWYEIAALAEKAEILLKGLKLSDLQGDRVAAEIYKHLGVETILKPDGILLVKNESFTTDTFCYDFKHCPDLAQPVAVTCAGLNLQARLTGLSGLRIKETDRLSALVNELVKAGYKALSVNGSELILSGSEVNQNERVSINTYNDHRMAMAFAPLSLLKQGIDIDDPAVVSKSYPGFWNDLLTAGFRLE